MSDSFEKVAIVMLLGGIALAWLHIGAVIYGWVRGAPEGQRPDLIPFPWGYFGVGFVVSFLGFYLARGASAGMWGGIQEVKEAVLVLAMASGGYGAAYEWAVYLGKARTGSARLIPLILSAFVGIALGAGATSIW